jgi:hypothetical protein
VLYSTRWGAPKVKSNSYCVGVLTHLWSTYVTWISCQVSITKNLTKQPQCNIFCSKFFFPITLCYCAMGQLPNADEIPSTIDMGEISRAQFGRMSTRVADRQYGYFLQLATNHRDYRLPVHYRIKTEIEKICLKFFYLFSFFFSGQLRPR